MKGSSSVKLQQEGWLKWPVTPLIATYNRGYTGAARQRPDQYGFSTGGCEENIDREHRSYQGNEGDTWRQLLWPRGRWTQTFKGQPKPLWLVWRGRKRLERSRQDFFSSSTFCTIPSDHRKWKVSAPPSCLSRWHWARWRFNYAAIERDSLISAGETWGFICTPRAVASARDDRTNCYLD